MLSSGKACGFCIARHFISAFRTSELDVSVYQLSVGGRCLFEKISMSSVARFRSSGRGKVAISIAASPIIADSMPASIKFFCCCMNESSTKYSLVCMAELCKSHRPPDKTSRSKTIKRNLVYSVDILSTIDSQFSSIVCSKIVYCFFAVSFDIGLPELIELLVVSAIFGPDDNIRKIAPISVFYIHCHLCSRQCYSAIVIQIPLLVP